MEVEEFLASRWAYRRARWIIVMSDAAVPVDPLKYLGGISDTWTDTFIDPQGHVHFVPG